MSWKSEGKRRRLRWRTKQRWLDVVKKDLKRLEVHEGRNKFQGRDKRREVVMAVKNLMEYHIKEN